MGLGWVRERRERLRLDVCLVNFPQSVKVVEMFLDVCGRMAGENGGDSGLVLDDNLWVHEKSSLVFLTCIMYLTGAWS